MLRVVTLWTLCALTQGYFLELADENDDETGRIFTNGFFLNSTSLAFLGSAALVASLLGILALLAFSNGPPAADNGGSYGSSSSNGYGYANRKRFDDYYVHPEYQDDFHKRSPVGDFTDQLHILADAFNKYEVEETTCQLYVACESAHTFLHEKHGRLAKTVYEVMQNMQTADNLPLVQNDVYLMDILDGYKIGESGQSCDDLRKSCRQQKIFLDQ